MSCHLVVELKSILHSVKEFPSAIEPNVTAAFRNLVRRASGLSTSGVPRLLVPVLFLAENLRNFGLPETRTIKTVVRESELEMTSPICRSQTRTFIKSDFLLF